MTSETVQQFWGLVLPALAVYAAIRADVSYLMKEQRRTNVRLAVIEKGMKNDKETQHTQA